jgi:hypothetical protein
LKLVHIWHTLTAKEAYQLERKLRRQRNFSIAIRANTKGKIMKSTSTFPNTSTRKKYKGNTRKIGYKILSESGIPHFEIDNTDSNCAAPTRARDFVQKQGITQAAIVSVLGVRKIDKFFWSKSGLYSLEHVAINYVGFPELAEAARNFHRREKQEKRQESLQSRSIY